MKCKSASELVQKPVVIVISDGGPDENPRYQRVIEVAVHHFKKRNLDAIFIATKAPQRSDYNRVERRMAPLSRDLTRLVLPHDFYGTHLDNKNETVDDNLEMKNFARLVKCWQAYGEKMSLMAIQLLRVLLVNLAKRT